MSPLRQPLKRPETYLAMLSIMILFVVLDSYRSPANQVTGCLYVTGVHLYQVIGRPLLKGRIQCRYQPTCSEYSIEAVRVYGIRRGLLLTVKRINSCTTKVPLGTPDPLLRAPNHGVAEGR
jgi:putative membrane protein insertion efficiency factor